MNWSNLMNLMKSYQCILSDEIVGKESLVFAKHQFE